MESLNGLSNKDGRAVMISMRISLILDKVLNLRLTQNTMTRLLLVLFIALVGVPTLFGQRNAHREAAKGEKSSEKSADKAAIQTAETKYLDLLMYYMDGEFEKCLKKSIKATEDDKTSSDPQPYLFVSKCYLELSLKEEYSKDYPDALKEALKYAVRYRKKDERSSEKQGLNYLEFWDDNKDFFERLREATKVEAQKMLDEGKANKAETWYKYVLNFDNSDYSAHFMMYSLAQMSGDTANGSKHHQAFTEEIGKVKEDMRYQPADKINLLRYGYMEYAKFLINQGLTQAAKETITEARTYLTKDSDLEAFIKEKQL